VGQPVPCIELRIVDSNGREVADGEIGEIVVRGQKIFLGYYRDPEETRRVLSPDGWFATGDLGYRAGRDAAYPGDIYLSGRKKEMIKRLGYLVHPAEVEKVLREHPGVLQCAVVGRSAGSDEDIVAFVQPVPDARLSTGDLWRFLAERLTPYKRPRLIVFVDPLPSLASGKVDKLALKEMAAKDPAPAPRAYEGTAEFARISMARHRSGRSPFDAVQQVTTRGVRIGGMGEYLEVEARNVARRLHQRLPDAQTGVRRRSQPLRGEPGGAWQARRVRGARARA